jgi:hypothetical protein
LWGKDDITGRISRNVNTQNPEEMRINHSYLTDKCKNLKHRLQGQNVAGTIVKGNFSQLMEKLWLI